MHEMVFNFLFVLFRNLEIRSVGRGICHSKVHNDKLVL